jgi:hypothetical protein
MDDGGGEDDGWAEGARDLGRDRERARDERRKGREWSDTERRTQ